MHNPNDLQLHAEGYISDFEDAMVLMQRLWKKVHPDCDFAEAEGTDTDGTELPVPQITFTMLHRAHTKEMSGGRKPKVMKSYPDPEQPGHNLSEQTEFFDCLTEFHIFGSSKIQTREWKNKLEIFMLQYAGYFKQQGIQEILFEEEGSPEVSTAYRQNLPHRVLRYMVRIQRTQVVRNIRVSEIEVEGFSQTSPGVRERLPTKRADDVFEEMYKKTQ